jgi:branched-chain amino acid transport system substrate-binding protein
MGGAQIRNVSRRAFLKSTAAGIGVLTFPGTSRLLRGEDKPLKIGVVSPVSGNYADHGLLERVGMEMALEDYGHKILGRPVELVVADDETNPDVAARRARRLIEVDGIKFFMGGVSTSTGLSVGAAAEENKVLFIATNQNGDQLTGEMGRKHVFRTACDMASLVRGGADYVAQNIGKKWFFLTHDYSWGQSGTAWARKMLDKVGGKEMGEVKVPLGTRDFSSQLLMIRNSGAEVLVITVAGFDNVALLNQLYEMRLYDKMKVWYTLMDAVDLFVVPKEHRQAYVCMETYYKSSPEMEKLNDRYFKKYPKLASPILDNTTFNGWLSVKMLFEGMKKAGTTEDVEKIICAMEDLTIKDNARKTPSLVRSWDHQVLTEVVFGNLKPVDGTDILDIKVLVSAEKVTRTHEENPIDLSCKN